MALCTACTFPLECAFACEFNRRIYFPLPLPHIQFPTHWFTNQTNTRPLRTSALIPRAFIFHAIFSDLWTSIWILYSAQSTLPQLYPCPMPIHRIVFSFCITFIHHFSLSLPRPIYTRKHIFRYVMVIDWRNRNIVAVNCTTSCTIAGPKMHKTVQRSPN